MRQVGMGLRQKQIILVITAFLPVYIFYLSISFFAINIPYWDDYDAILNFVNKFLDVGLQDKISLIFSQHNEHRIAFTRVIVLATYYLIGKINFKLLTFIGNIGLIGLLIVLLKSFIPPKNKFLHFIPAIFVLFQPQYWGSIYFATPSISNLYVLFFAFLAIYLLSKQRIKYFLFSLLLAISATFTNGNGLFVFFIGLLSLLYQKRDKEIMLWIFVGIVCISFYFYGYIKVSHHPSIADSIFIRPLQTLIYFFCFIGSSFMDFGFKYLKPVYLLPLLIGIFYSLYFLYLIKIKYYKKNGVVFLFLLFLFINGFVAALGRSGFGIMGAFPSRYRIISILFLILFYFSMMEILPQEITKRLFSIMLVLAILFNLFSYYSYSDNIILQKKYLIEGLVLWRKHNSGLSYPDENRANSIMSDVITNKLYCPPGIFLGNSRLE